MLLLAGQAPGSGFVISGWLGLCLAVFGITGLAGFVYVYFRSTVSKTAIENYKSAYESMHARVDEMDETVKETRAHADKCEAELAGMHQAYDMLADQVRGTAQIQALGGELNRRLDELTTTVKTMASDLNEGQDHMAAALGNFVLDLRKKFQIEDLDRRQT